MTANQIAYWNYVESQRANKAKEAENERSNKAKEAENYRTNVANEGIRRDTLTETKRSNLVNEAFTARKLTDEEKTSSATRSNIYDSMRQREIQNKAQRAYWTNSISNQWNIANLQDQFNRDKLTVEGIPKYVDSLSKLVDAFIPG